MFPEDSIVIMLGGAILAGLVLSYLLFKWWRERRPSPVPWWIGHIDPAPTAPPAPPYWTCTRRSLYQVEV